MDRGSFASIFAGVVVLTSSATLALAQSPPNADQRRAAGQAYDRGSAAYLAGEYAQAATYYETAHRLAPSAPALVQAARAHERAGNVVRAATLALRLEKLYPDDRLATETRTRILEANASRLVLVEVVCDGCSVELDGTLLEHPSFFVEPDTEHRVAGHFDTGDVGETVSGAAGERREIAFDAPPPSESTETSTPGPETGADSGAGGGLPMFVVIAAGVLTLGAGGTLIWSGVDTLSGVDEYEAAPTPQALAAGQSKETRTNVLIGVTAGLAIATAVLAIFTDWDGTDGEETRAAVAPVPGGAAAILEGTF